ncbi:MAG: hypothetical protein ACI9E1_001330 [Cryomorphaceae bacterium]|jgi:hypothetical protein
MEIFRAQLSRYIPHPHRDSWMRNNLDAWLQLLRIGSFLTLSAAAWSIAKTSSPLGISGQFQPILEQTTSQFFQENENWPFSLSELQLYIKYGFAAFFAIAALTSLRCGAQRKPKYILPVFIAGILLVIAAAKYCYDSDFKIISIIPFLLPIATPFLLLGYRRLANKVDHWNSYANFLCVTTIFGNALTFLFHSDKVPLFNASAFTSIGLPTYSGEIMMTVFSYVAIFFAFLTAFSLTRRLGLFVLIAIGGLSSIYRVLALIFNSEPAMSYHLIIADSLFYISYWLIPLLILLSLASRRKTQTLKL